MVERGGGCVESFSFPGVVVLHIIQYGADSSHAGAGEGGGGEPVRGRQWGEPG